MNALLRAVAIAAGVAAIWTVAAGRVAAQMREPADAVVANAILTQPFGCTALAVEPFDPYCPSRHFHSGVDLAAPEGTPVHAATGGRALVGYDQKGCGTFVSVAFDAHVRVLYCHLHSAAVFPRANVEVGELIGAVGSSGLATGAHLHLEIDVDGRAVDPVRWLAGSGP